MLARLKAVLPPRWFPDTAPVLDAMLSGVAEVWSQLYGQLQWVQSQTRILTASGAFLDMIAGDFFGGLLRRRSIELDATFRMRIQRELLRERGTRQAVIAALTDLTGRAPMVFEPARPADTRGWNASAGYGVAGGWGNLDLPMQCLVTAYRPAGQGIGVVAGWSTSASGWGVGAGEYGSLAEIAGQVTDAEIAEAVVRVMPAASIAWLRIAS